jgi:anhydro-N-acetylmuramic acid kinase
LTAFTAASIARAREFFPEPATTWIVTGGGRHNKFLMDQLRARVNAPVLATEDAGWDGDAMEAEAFAYLAMRSKKGLPLSLPTTTGVKQPMTGGKYHRH